MTPIEWITLANLVIIPVLGFIWKQWRGDVANERLRDFIDDAVRAAEELNANTPMLTTKETFVRRAIQRKFPKLSTEDTEILLNAALHAAGLGASSKPPKKPSMDMDIPGQ